MMGVSIKPVFYDTSLTMVSFGKGLMTQIVSLRPNPARHSSPRKEIQTLCRKQFEFHCLQHAYHSSFG